MNTNFYCVILAGGIGMRLWPSSRQHKPKQFIDLLGTGKTLLQTTYSRFAAFMPPENIIVVSNSVYKDLVNEQLPELPEENLLLEPIRRNTIPAVAWAALEICRRNPKATMVVSPADQNITDIDGQPTFAEEIQKGLIYASENKRLLTLGVKPTRPEVAYGYIQMSDSMSDDIYKVQSFTEKPELEFAKIFMESGEFLWNTGLFIWGAHTLLDSMHGIQPGYSGFLANLISRFASGQNDEAYIDDMYSMTPNLALEQGLLEKADNVDVMLCHFGWADLGTWNNIFDYSPKDANNNVVVASKAVLYGCNDCVVRLPEGHVAVLQGLSNYVVVEEDNVIVVCPKDDLGAIRKFANDAQLNLGEDYV